MPTGAISRLAATPMPAKRVGSTADGRRHLHIARNAAGVVAVIALLAALAFTVISMRGDGIRLITVQGSSMGDAIPIGSVVVARWQDRSDVTEGDVILAREEAETGTATPKLHRVIKIDTIDGERVVTLKGDANATADPGEFKLPPRVLVSEFHVPYAGYLLAMLGSPLGWMLAIALPFVALAFLAIATIWRTPKPSEN